MTSVRTMTATVKTLTLACECTSPWRVNNQYSTEVAHRDVMAAEVRITERAEKARAVLAADLLILAGSDR